MISGILLLDKPLGLSSNAALQRARRLLGGPKAGHVGSLDPLATGMLPICLGEATKVASHILSARKSYRFAIALGSRTATGDREGAVVETAAVPVIQSATIMAALARFMGPQKQTPPMYSALKRDGQPLYALARAGLEVDREARDIEIFDLRLISHRADSLELEVLSSKGTYVRTLGEDISRALGTCGHLTQLRRLYVEPFQGLPMETLDGVAAAVEAGRLPGLLPADAPLQHIPRVALDAQLVIKVRRGQSVRAPSPIGAEHGQPMPVRLYGPDDTFIGLGEADDFGFVQPRRLFVSDER